MGLESLFSDFMDNIKYLSNTNYIKCLDKNMMDFYCCVLPEFLRSDHLDIGVDTERARTVFLKVCSDNHLNQNCLGYLFKYTFLKSPR